jgi:hypothetical protein
VLDGAEAADARKGRRTLTRLRKAERRLIGFFQRVRSLTGTRVLAHPDPDALVRTGTAIRDDVLALRETFR